MSRSRTHDTAGEVLHQTSPSSQLMPDHPSAGSSPYQPQLKAEVGSPHTACSHRIWQAAPTDRCCRQCSSGCWRWRAYACTGASCARASSWCTCSAWRAAQCFWPYGDGRLTGRLCGFRGPPAQPSMAGGCSSRSHRDLARSCTPRGRAGGCAPHHVLTRPGTC